MSREILNNNGDGTDSVNIAGTNISLKQLQSIYNEMTGKKETLSKRITDSFEINFDDLQQLDYKINQTIDKYKIQGKNVSVTFYHIDDNKCQFSTFDRAKLYDKSNISPCENVRLEYNILISLPNVNTPQSYKIAIDLASRVGIFKKNLSQSDMPKRFFRFFLRTTGTVEIEYIDYTVARDLQNTIDHWFSSIKKNKTPMLLKTIQNYSDLVPVAFQILSILILLVYLYSFKAAEIFPSNSKIEDHFLTTLILFPAFYILGIISRRIGHACELYIDNLQSLSFIDINRGDKNAIEEFKKTNRNQIISIILTFILQIIFQAISGWITLEFISSTPTQ